MTTSTSVATMKAAVLTSSFLVLLAACSTKSSDATDAAGVPPSGDSSTPSNDAASPDDGATSGDAPPVDAGGGNLDAAPPPTPADGQCAFVITDTTGSKSYTEACHWDFNITGGNGFILADNLGTGFSFSVLKPGAMPAVGESDGFGSGGNAQISHVGSYCGTGCTGAMKITDHTGNVLKGTIDAFVSGPPNAAGPPNMHILGAFAAICDSTGASCPP